MSILVFNGGSSSLKVQLYRNGRDDSLEPHLGGAVTGLGGRSHWRWRSPPGETEGEAELSDHREAARWVLGRLRAANVAIEAVGHRVVHGGDIFKNPVRLTPETIARLASLNHLAPLHNPPALDVIDECRKVLGADTPMVAVFDTAFHATLPEAARRYALPREWIDAYGIRRYGFHGLAHRYMYERYLQLDQSKSSARRVLTFQLGNGCSACAIRDGRSVETSMGYTPLEGLIMATRSGDVDPGVLVRVMARGPGADTLERGLNHASGLLALSGATADMRTLLALEADGHDGARLAVEAFCHRARKYLGAYLAVLGGADAILFGGGIGENAPTIRARICADMEWCGLRLDLNANNRARGSEQCVSAGQSSMAVYVIKVEEELLIARDVQALLGAKAVE